MPEGDTIHRAARTLQSALAGQTVTRFETALAPLARVDVAGRRIERVAAVGKHLLIEFSGDLFLRTHMRMNGSWHIYRAGERWKRPRRDMRVVIETAEWTAVAFSVPVAEFLDFRALARQRDLAAIGPDLLAETFDADEALRRIRSRPDDEIANVLLNQRVVAGIGNVYKSEVLFLERINPFTRVASLTDDQLARILALSRKLMQVNTDRDVHTRRTTGSLRGEAALWVYSRSGEPCRKCGTPIAYKKQGPDARGTYWCPTCQPLSSDSAPEESRSDRP